MRESHVSCHEVDNLDDALVYNQYTYNMQLWLLEKLFRYDERDIE